MFLPMPTLALHLAALACLLGALDGAYGLISPRCSSLGPGIELAEGAALAPLRALAGARLTSHAATLAVLLSAPAVGACLAATLGSAWLGAAMGRAVSILIERRRAPADFLRVTGTMLMGVLTWAPLWLYLQAIRASQGFGA